MPPALFSVRQNPQRTPEGTPLVLSRLRPRWTAFLSSLPRQSSIDAAFSLPPVVKSVESTIRLSGSISPRVYVGFQDLTPLAYQTVLGFCFTLRL